MKNRHLAEDYRQRARIRLKAIETLLKEKAYADVVRECQEAVELALKGLLRSWNIEVPRIHDVSEILEEESRSKPQGSQIKTNRLCRASRHLRRDRELAFYGSEDLTPSEFYKLEEAAEALTLARDVIDAVDELWSSDA